MRNSGELLFRVAHFSCPKGGMGRTRENYFVVGIDARPYEVAFGRLFANEAPIH
jgi:hypothetical protein